MQTVYQTVVFNWRNAENICGQYPIHLRITIDRRSCYYTIPVPLKISPEQWSGREDNWVKNSHPYAFEINDKIKEKKAIVSELIKRHYLANKTLSFEVIDRYLKKKGDPQSFIDYMKDYIRNPPEKLELNTIKKYSTCLIHLQKFRPAISFADINEDLMKGFFQYLHKTLGLEGASIKKYFSALKKVIKTARRDNHIDSSSIEFLYADVKITVRPSTRRVFLELEEIRKWKALELPKNKIFLERDRDMFLFQIYTGYYYKDLRILRKDQLMKDEEYGYFILGERDKNGNDTIIPIFKFPYALKIMEKYAAEEKSDLVFGSDAFIEEPVYNRNLKEIGRMAGIHKQVYNKVGRHTNAQLYVRFGAQTSIVSKMLGHTKEETTRHYYKVNIPEIIEGTKGIDFVKMGI